MPFDSRDGTYMDSVSNKVGAGWTLGCWHLLMTSSIVGTPDAKRDDCRCVKWPTELGVRVLLSAAAAAAWESVLVPLEASMAGTSSLNETSLSPPSPWLSWVLAENAAGSCGCWLASRSGASAACRFVMMSGMLCGVCVCGVWYGDQHSFLTCLGQAEELDK